jgi:hypothetical protein
MLSARHYTEIRITNRLNKSLPDDRINIDDLFNEILNKQDIQNLIHHFSQDIIPGFSPEDLEGFYVMKIHQCLRRGNEFKNEFTYFAKCFESLNRDIIKMYDRTAKSTFRDPLDDCEFWGERGLLF